MSAYLRRFVPERTFKSIGVDIRDFRTGCTKLLADEFRHELRTRTRKKLAGAEDVTLRGMPPLVHLCFIDGDHSYEGVRADIVWLKDRRRYLMFHDMFDRDCPGVVKQWLELTEGVDESSYWECIEQPTGLAESQHKTQFGRKVARLGIGIISTTAVRINGSRHLL